MKISMILIARTGITNATVVCCQHLYLKEMLNFSRD